MIINKSATAEMKSTFSAEDNAKIKKHYEENAIYYGIYQMQMKADRTFIQTYVENESLEEDQENGTYKFENGKLIIYWGKDDINEFDAVLANGVLTVYYDETDEYEQSSTLIKAGLSYPNAGKVTKFIGKIEYSRK